VDGAPGLVMDHSATYHHGRDLDGDSVEVHAGIYSVIHGYTRHMHIHTQAITCHGIHHGIVRHITHHTGGDQ
jgi:hypothetical protein